MIEALIYFGYSVVVLIILTALYVVEDRVGRRVLLPRLRNAVDVRLAKIFTPKAFFGLGFMRLLLHYGANNILGSFSRFLQKCEKRVASLANRNRAIAKDISNTKKQHRTHLNKIADYKSEVALSESEKKKMRSH